MKTWLDCAMSSESEPATTRDFTRVWRSVFAVILLKNGARTSSPALRVPMSVIYSGVVIGGGCSVLFAIYAAIGHTKSNFSGQSKEVS